MGKAKETKEVKTTDYAEELLKPLRVKATDDGIVPVEDDRLLNIKKIEKAFASKSADLVDYLLEEVVNTFEGSDTDQEHKAKACNRSLAILNGINPKDEIEAMLAVQMIGVHNVVMMSLRRSTVKGQPLHPSDLCINHAAKMARTFTQQMDALKRYRTGGQQKVTVEHVHVNEGGQAIVGTVNRGGGGGSEESHE